MATEWAISTLGLTKHFDRHTAVQNVDLQITSGEVYGLIGPNGAGKTTLIRLLAAAEDPTLGEIHIHGERLVRNRDNQSLKRRIGYLPDDFPLYDDLTVWDYLDYFARLYQLKEPYRSQRIREVLDLANLTAKQDSRIAGLSRGMKQRLGLARTIIHGPVILLLDEPVSGLDPMARQQFREMIKALQEVGMTIVISSHVLTDLAELCTSIGIMELGNLVENCSLADLYRRLARRQIDLQSLDDLEALQAQLRSYPGIEAIQILNGQQQLRVIFSGGETEAADLLQHLIRQGIRLTEFHNSQEDLESIFLKLGHQQVS